jgi:hypothetical protein
LPFPTMNDNLSVPSCWYVCPLSCTFPSPI